MRREHVVFSIMLVLPLVVLILVYVGSGWSGKLVAAFVSFLVAAVFLYLIVRWHASAHAYVCPKCEHTFAISALDDFANPHYPGHKSLRCPSCRQRSWCREVARTDAHQTQQRTLDRVDL